MYAEAFFPNGMDHVFEDDDGKRSGCNKIKRKGWWDLGSQVFE